MVLDALFTLDSRSEERKIDNGLLLNQVTGGAAVFGNLL